MGRSELVVDEPQQVALGLAVERQPRFVQQQDDRLAGVLDLSELHQEREEPDEAGAPLREGRVDPMQIVLDAGPRDGPGVEGRRVARSCLVDLHLHVQVGILRPVLEYLFSDVR